MFTLLMTLYLHRNYSVIPHIYCYSHIFRPRDAIVSHLQSTDPIYNIVLPLFPPLTRRRVKLFLDSWHYRRLIGGDQSTFGAFTSVFLAGIVRFRSFAIPKALRLLCLLLSVPFVVTYGYSYTSSWSGSFFFVKKYRSPKRALKRLAGSDVPSQSFVSQLPPTILIGFPSVIIGKSRTLSLSLPLYRTCSHERQGLCWVSLVIRALIFRGTSSFGGCQTDCGSGLVSCSNLSWNTTDDTLREVSVVFCQRNGCVCPVPGVSPIRTICNCRLSHSSETSWMYAFVFGTLCGVVVSYYRAEFMCSLS
jgi:hypothetical protein